MNVTWYHILLFFKDYHSDNLVQNSRTSNYGLSQDIKKPLGGLISSDLSSSHPGHAHAFSHYSQMGMTAAKSHMMGGTVPGGGMTPPTGAHPAATHRSSITDFFGKMMSFSSCQTPVLPSYYQNSMYSTEKIDSHLWFGSFVWEKSRQNLISSCSLKVKKKFCPKSSLKAQPQQKLLEEVRKPEVATFLASCILHKTRENVNEGYRTTFNFFSCFLLGCVLDLFQIDLESVLLNKLKLRISPICVQFYLVELRSSPRWGFDNSQ